MKEITIFTTFIILGFFVLYKTANYSIKNCKTVNSSIEDYRKCINA